KPSPLAGEGGSRAKRVNRVRGSEGKKPLTRFVRLREQTTLSRKGRGFSTVQAWCHLGYSLDRSCLASAHCSFENAPCFPRMSCVKFAGCTCRRGASCKPS